jgi:peptidoglycan/LPS O-acetylase OafA/YrhL
VPELLIFAGGVGVVSAIAALCLQGRQRIDRRCFAGLVALAVASSLFAVLGWAATTIARIAPLPLTWALVIVLAVLIGARLYRELQVPLDGSQ